MPLYIQSQHRHSTPTQPALISLSCCLISCPDLTVCAARARAFHCHRPFLCLGNVEVNPPLSGNGLKTMESARHGTANGFTAASSPHSLFMCRSIHRVLMAPAMHDTDSFKSPPEEEKTHLQSWQKTIRESLDQHFVFIYFLMSKWGKIYCL